LTRERRSLPAADVERITEELRRRLNADLAERLSEAADAGSMDSDAEFSSDSEDSENDGVP
jgi:hypothetical protein